MFLLSSIGVFRDVTQACAGSVFAGVWLIRYFSYSGAQRWSLSLVVVEQPFLFLLQNDGAAVECSTVVFLQIKLEIMYFLLESKRGGRKRCGEGIKAGAIKTNVLVGPHRGLWRWISNLQSERQRKSINSQSQVFHEVSGDVAAQHEIQYSKLSLMF